MILGPGEDIITSKSWRELSFIAMVKSEDNPITER